jgi:hypothetical protein
VRCIDGSEGYVSEESSSCFPWFEEGVEYEMTNITSTGRYTFAADVEGIGHVTDLLTSCFELPKE